MVRYRNRERPAVSAEIDVPYMSQSYGRREKRGSSLLVALFQRLEPRSSWRNQDQEEIPTFVRGLQIEIPDAGCLVSRVNVG
jgi:hypothetical protein